MAFHCELAWLGGDRPAGDVLIEVADGTINSVAVGVAAPAGAVALRGLTLPGLANAHSHAFHRALRGRTHDGRGTFWTWRQQMYRLAAALDPDSYMALARATFGEMVLAGITCVGEFHYLHHRPGGGAYADPNAFGASLAEAAADAGLRMTLLDTCYLQGGFGAELDAVQRRFADADVERWIERVELLTGGDRLRVGAAVHSVRAVDPASIARIATWVANRGCPLHAHVSEQPAENEQCHIAYGCSPVGLLDAQAALGDRFTAVHATHLDDDALRRLSQTRSIVCMCPTTERDLGDGVARTRDFRAAAIPICLGSDSHAVIDLFEEARAVELDERLISGMRGVHDVDALLEAATSVGYRSLGWPEGGRIEAGAVADLVAISLRSVRTAGASSDTALATAVYAAGAADVTDVIVGGERIVADGCHRSIDVAAELERSIGKVWGSVA